MFKLAEFYAVQSFANDHFLRQAGLDALQTEMQTGGIRYIMSSKRVNQADRRHYWFYELQVVNTWNESLLFFGNGTNLDFVLGTYEQFQRDHEELHPVADILPRTMYDSIW